MKPRDPFAQAVEMTTAAYDQIAENYAERNEDLLPHWKSRLDEFVDMVHAARERHPIAALGRPSGDESLEEYLQLEPVLDAGCGHGRDARALAGCGLDVLAIDLSQGMLDAAGERTPRRMPKGSVRYAIMDLRSLDLPQRSVRGVWCSASLLHVPLRTAPRAIAELARVAKPESPVVIFLKQRQDEIKERFVPYESPTGDAPQRYYAYYTVDEAVELVESASLRTLNVSVVPHRNPELSPPWISILATKPL